MFYSPVYSFLIKVTVMKELVTQHDGKNVTTSLMVAETFGKQHKHVLRSVQNLDCSAEFTESNYGLSSYNDSTGRSLPFYYMTKDGFTFLVMGFRGEKAAKFKEDFIRAFNQMEKSLSSPSTAKQLLMQAEYLVSMENRMDTFDVRLSKLEKLENGLDYLSIAGFGSQIKRHISRVEAIRLGKEVTRYCKSNGIPISTTEHERYGYVNVYPKHVLERFIG